VQGTYPYLNGTPKGTRTRTSYQYAKRWFWPGQRVRVNTTTLGVNGGLLNLFVPFALFMALAQPTETVEVYELVTDGGEAK
jgi:hypothetical protein